MYKAENQPIRMISEVSYDKPKTSVMILNIQLFIIRMSPILEYIQIENGYFEL